MTTHSAPISKWQSIKLNEDDLLEFAEQMASVVQPGTTIFLSGELGVGKTTFTRGFLRALGYMGKVKSPTYGLVETYQLKQATIYHFDLYRLKTAKELQEIGIQEYFTPDAICLIEWPEKGFPVLPIPDLACYIDFSGESRKIKLNAHSEIGAKVISSLL